MKLYLNFFSKNKNLIKSKKHLLYTQQIILIKNLTLEQNDYKEKLKKITN